MRIVLAIAIKNLHLLWRDRIGFFWWILGFPLLIAVFMGSIFAGVVGGKPRPIAVAVVDESPSEATRAFDEQLESTQALNLSRMELDVAREAVRRGDLAAFVVLQSGFQITPSILAGEALPLSIGVDPSRHAERAFLQGILKESAAEFLRSRWMDPKRRPEAMEAWFQNLQERGALSPDKVQGLEMLVTAVDRYLTASGSMKELTSKPSQTVASIETVSVVRDRSRPRSAFEICFPIGVIWGLLGLTAQSAMAMVQEREAGTMMRLRVAPISRTQLLVGNGLASFLASTGVIVLLLAVGRIVFGVRLQNPLVVGAAALCIALCFVGLTMMLSVMGRTRAAVSGASWASLLVMSMLGGGMVPRIFMPPWTEIGSHISPIKWAIVALEAGIWRDLPLADVMLPCGVMLLQGALCAAIGIRILSRAHA